MGVPTRRLHVHTIHAAFCQSTCSNPKGMNWLRSARVARSRAAVLPPGAWAPQHLHVPAPACAACGYLPKPCALQVHPGASHGKFGRRRRLPPLCGPLATARPGTGHHSKAGQAARRLQGQPPAHEWCAHDLFVRLEAAAGLKTAVWERGAAKPEVRGTAAGRRWWCHRVGGLCGPCGRAIAQATAS